MEITDVADTGPIVRVVTRWKWLGLAGLVGAAAVGGTVVAVQRRQRRTWDEVDGDELRSRLHERLRAGQAATSR